MTTTGRFLNEWKKRIIWSKIMTNIFELVLVWLLYMLTAY